MYPKWTFINGRKTARVAGVCVRNKTVRIPDWIKCRLAVSKCRLAVSIVSLPIIKGQ